MTGRQATYPDDQRRVGARRGGSAPALAALMFAALTGFPAAGASAEAVPSLSINDVSVTEGNSGTVDAVFTVRPSAAPSQDVSVAVATADGTATAVGDYEAKQATLTFPAGSAVVAQTVAVRVFGDKVPEQGEEFVVSLSNPTNAIVADADGRGTIVDDDPFPQLSISDAAAVVEGDAGTVDAVFTVTLPRSDSVTSQPVTVEFATFDSTATAGSDYGPKHGTLTFPATLPGVSQQALEVRVPVFGETAREARETFSVSLSNPTNAVLADSFGLAGILNDDTGIQLSGASLTESSGTHLVFVRLTHASALPVTVTYATADRTAKAGSDYVAVPPKALTFVAGEASRFVGVSTIDDQVGEPDETFFLNFSNPVNATIDTTQALFTITDNEPRITIADASVADAFRGPQPAHFAVTVSGSHPSHEVRIGYGTAVAGRDYAARSGTLVFPASSTQAQMQIIRVGVIGDTAVEQDETFFVNLSNPVGAFITDGRGEGTVFDASDIGGVGGFELTPTDPRVEVHERLGYAFTWTVPSPASWHDLDLLELRIRDDAGTIIWIRFH